MKIIRTYLDNVTPGKILLANNLIGHSLELPWKQNRQNISCIAEGAYEIVKYIRDGKIAFKVLDVPGRTLVRIHIGNFLCDTIGCILPGLVWDPAIPSVVHSTVMMNRLDRLIPERSRLLITS